MCPCTLYCIGVNISVREDVISIYGQEPFHKLSVLASRIKIVLCIMFFENRAFLFELLQWSFTTLCNVSEEILRIREWHWHFLLIFLLPNKYLEDEWKFCFNLICEVGTVEKLRNLKPNSSAHASEPMQLLIVSYTMENAAEKTMVNVTKHFTPIKWTKL